MSALAVAGAMNTSLVACSSDVEVEDAYALSDEEAEITIAPFPGYADETRAVDEKSSWQSGDVIYISVEGGTYVELKYDGSTWDTSSLTLKKGQSYKAVYAPNYELNNERTGLVLKYGQIAATGEYLVYEGSAYPFIISFTRNYSRIRIDVDHYTSGNDFLIVFGDGFMPNDESGAKTISISCSSWVTNLYLYGSWTDNTRMDIFLKSYGLDTVYQNGVFGSNLYRTYINGDSEGNKSYACSFDYIYWYKRSQGYWLVENLDDENSSFSEWSSFSTQREVQDTYSFQGIKVVGTWDENKAPNFQYVFVYVSEEDMMGHIENTDENDVNGEDSDYSTGESYTPIQPGRIDLSDVTGLTTIPSEYFRDNYTTKEIDLPNGIKKIEEKAFFYCKKLQWIKLSESLQSIGYEAFYGCDALATVVCYSTTPPTLGYDAFESCDTYYYDEYTGDTTKAKALYVPKAVISDYQNSDWGNYFSNILSIENDLPNDYK